jgi:hypothetical protein
MLLPSTSYPFFTSFTSQANRLDSLTKTAAARAWRPSLFFMVKTLINSVSGTGE